MNKVANLVDWFSLSIKRHLKKSELMGIENLLGGSWSSHSFFSLVKCLCFSQAINLASEMVYKA